MARSAGVVETGQRLDFSQHIGLYKPHSMGQNTLHEGKARSLIQADIRHWSDGRSDLASPRSGATQRIPLQISLGVRDRWRTSVGYDNERGKGDHKHLRSVEIPYRFVDVPTLLADFMKDVQEIQP